MSRAEGKTIAVVGGGLVGGVNACLLAKRGFKVDLYELRPDIRKSDVVRGRSINLALSKRGRDALAAIGYEDHVVGSGIPMYARMIHDLHGNRRPIPYGRPDQFIMSIDRKKLNELVIDAAEAQPSVNIHFGHRFVKCDFKTGDLTFEKAKGEKVEKKADLIIGNDGAFSAVRQQISKTTRLNFSQEYIPHGYMELSIPATSNGEFAMEKNYLHIWPRNEFMMIALPNTEDKSFVVTLFMPFDIFDTIKTQEDVMNFFETTFPDSIPLIGRESLVQTMLSSKPLPMVSIKCGPYHVGHKALIMGDAAHAMVPFYGQGMNCGLEDILVFAGLLDKYNDDLELAVPGFTDARNSDAKAICDLAMYNYVEMRKSVNSRLFLMRKKIDSFLHRVMPETWVPLYTMVSFTRTPYSQCIRKREWQDKVLSRATTVVFIASVVGGSFLAMTKLHQGYKLEILCTVSSFINDISKRIQFFRS